MTALRFLFQRNARTPDMKQKLLIFPENFIWLDRVCFSLLVSCNCLVVLNVKMMFLLLYYYLVFLNKFPLELLELKCDDTPLNNNLKIKHFSLFCCIIHNIRPTFLYRKSSIVWVLVSPFVCNLTILAWRIPEIALKS